MRLKKYELKAQHPIRAPHEDATRIDSIAKWDYDYFNEGYYGFLEKAINKPDHYQWLVTSLPYKAVRILRELHGRGDPIEEISQRVVEAIELTEYTQQQYPTTLLPWKAGSPYLDDCGALAICLLLVPDKSIMMRFKQLICIKDNERFYPYDIFLKAFIQDWEMVDHYPTKGGFKFQLVWSIPFTRALASHDRTEALARYMQKFERLIKTLRPGKWLPWAEYKVKVANGKKINSGAFHHFAFEVALTVCAYDLDDSEFREHPYYPRELVDYYREHIRHTRDDWRADGVGADVVVKLPPVRKKIELGKSKSTNFKRWLELISDGDVEAGKSVIRACGSLRQMRDPIRLFEELSDNGIALFTDLKNDSSLESTLLGLIESRNIQDFEAPETAYPAGSGRSEGILRHAAMWLKSFNYSLHVIDMNADCWGAVLVRDEYDEEYIALSSRLSLPKDLIS